MSRTQVEHRTFSTIEEKFDFYAKNPNLLREEFPADRFLCYIVSKLKKLPAYTRGDELYILRYGFDIKLEDLVKMRTFPPRIIKGLERAVKNMESGMTVERMFGRVYFYGHELMIKNQVLCPRPETELLVERVIKQVEQVEKRLLPLKDSNPIIEEPYFYMPKTAWAKQNPATPYVLDLCTGSGCIGVSVAKACPFCYVTLSDISLKAMDNARCNIHLLNTIWNTRLNRAGDMFEKIEGRFDVIVSNPPYIKQGDIPGLSKQVTDYDPILALDGGKDGLKFYNIIAGEAKHYLREDGVVIMEIGSKQGNAVRKIFEKNGYEVEVIKDYASKDRIVVAKPLEYEKENSL